MRSPAVQVRTIGLGAIICAVFLLLVVCAPADATEYRFGPDDKIRLSIFEWRPSLDETFGWEALNNEFTVGVEGDLSLPLLGRVQAGGLSRDELSLHVAEQLSKRMGLGREPTVAIEIVEYRPFYIIGPVSTSGAFPYRSGLTVLQAVSLAGGLRMLTADLFDTGHQTITSAGDLNVLLLQRDNLQARAVRLEAELARAAEIEFPKELLDRRSEPAVATLLQTEQRIFSARVDAYSTQMRALDQLKRNLATELPSLSAQLETVETQVQLIEEELESVHTLMKSGLANQPRRMGLERELARTEGDRLRVESSLLRAKQEISKFEISIVELRSRRAQEITAELGETQARLEELGRRIETTMRLVSAFAAASPYVVEGATPGRVAEPVYHIVRRVDDAMTEMPAGENTPVLPGDTVKVNIRLVQNDFIDQHKPRRPDVVSREREREGVGLNSQATVETSDNSH
ncbi:MAG TPA: polysaccharide biosynthesis/export family protein [Erythrobacter sp.]|nr:polysaccharide biosynthesis/export family protein [Erythrobacter sp.]